MAPPPRVGLVFLDDVHSIGPWNGDRAREWRDATGADGEHMPPTVFPPPAVVAVVRSVAWALLEQSAGWLALADHVIVVVDETGDVPADPELVALERSDIRERLSRKCEIRATEAAGLRSTIERALEDASTRGERAWPTLGTFEPPPAVPSGPWVRFELPRFLERHSVDLVLAQLSRGLCLPPDGPALLDWAKGERFDLRTGARVTVPGLGGEPHARLPVAAAPDGARWLARAGSRTSSSGHRWSIDGALPGPPQEGGWGLPVAIDPAGRVAWAGGRCRFHWRVPTEIGCVYWTENSRDWPCGHAKKLYGYKDNDPVSIAMSPDGSACLSTYDHDVLLTPGLPLRWRDVRGYALAERVTSEPRALLFQRSDAEDAYPGDPYEADEDARDRMATVTLGPTAEARYVVGLDGPTYRLAEGRVTRLGGPADEWVVFDAQHRVTHRDRGRLLAGFHRWVVVLDGDTLRRVDLITHDSEDLGAPGRPVDAGLAVPGTPNAVLVARDRDAAWLRVV